MEEGGSRIKILNEMTVSIQSESHTLINPLRWVISNSWVGDEVEFCGYTIPHPSVDEAHLTVQLEESRQSPGAVLEKMTGGLSILEKCADRMMEELEKAKNSFEYVL